MVSTFKCSKCYAHLGLTAITAKVVKMRLMPLAVSTDKYEFIVLQFLEKKRESWQSVSYCKETIHSV